MALLIFNYFRKQRKRRVIFRQIIFASPFILLLLSTRNIFSSNLSFSSLTLFSSHRVHPPSFSTSFFWTRPSLISCLESGCLAAAPFNHSNSTQAHDRLHAYLRRTPTQPPRPPTHFLRNMSNSSCAVVGGAPHSPSTNFTTLSAQIDGMDIVVRLNVRVPSLLAAEGHESRLGKRTDILIIQRGSMRNLLRYQFGWGGGNGTLAKKRRLAGKTLKNVMMVFRTECGGVKKGCAEAWDVLEKEKAFTKWKDLRLLGWEVENQVRQKLWGTEKAVATTGFVSVWAMLGVCKEVGVFGMNGTLTGDGDRGNITVWRGHKLNRERQVLRELEKSTGGNLRIYS